LTTLQNFNRFVEHVVTEDKTDTASQLIVQQLFSNRAAARFFEAVVDDVDVLQRVGLLMKDMVQTMALSDHVDGTESLAAWCNLLTKELLDESFLPNQIADLLKSADYVAIRQSMDASLRHAAARDFHAYISILNGHSDTSESLAREVLSGHH
jgi:hypothetical protein